jgi:purine-binding chemotaxis protein CheW
MNTASQPYVIFELAGAAYGIASADVLHVDLLEHVTAVPNTSATVEGVVFSRGQVVPALNLRLRFGLPRREPDGSTRLIFVRSGGRTVALIVDAAREFRALPASVIRPVEETLQGVAGNYLRGVAQLGDRMVLLIDVVSVIALDPLPEVAESAVTASAL